MSTTTVRKQAPRLPRPAARYWKGKAPKGVVEVESESDIEEEEQHVEEEELEIPISGEQEIIAEGEEVGEGERLGGAAVLARRVSQKVSKSMSVALKDVNISKDGKVIVAGREESGRTLLEEEISEEEVLEEEEAGVKEEEEEEESSEYESESEEEPPKPQFRPVFVPKRARITIAEKREIATDTEEALQRKEKEAEERRKQSHDMVAESIKREIAEKEKEADIHEVDDTDGLDPEGEFEAWRLRELGRIKKEKEEEMQREREREEVERRRALPEEQRLKEDLERAKKLREEKPKGKQKFLQKYWHKGAFHQDEEILKRHDYTEATESTVDVSLLPKVMQVRNFGKRSRTKYTHLLDQDTTVGTGGFGGSAPVKAGGLSLDGGGCFICGGPHLKKDCPQNTAERKTGANNIPTGPGRGADGPQRREYDRGRWEDRRRDDGRSWYEDGRRKDWRRRSYSRSRSRSRSRSPAREPRRRDYEYEAKTRRRRSRERSVEVLRDKRRRLD